MPKEIDPTLAAFGAALRAVRKEVGLSQEQLADRAGLDRAYVGGVERGERNVALLNIVRLARAAGTTPGELLLRPEFAVGGFEAPRRFSGALTPTALLGGTASRAYGHRRPASEISAIMRTVEDNEIGLGLVLRHALRATRLCSLAPVCLS